MAAQLEGFLLHHVELCGHGLGIGDALGVGATYKTADVVGYLGVELFDNLVVLNVDDGGQRCHQGYLAHLLNGEMFVLDLDDTLLAQLAAIQVVADKHLVLVLFEAKYTNYLIDITSGDMIYDCSILDGRNHHFFLAFHDCSFFRC